MLFKKMFRDLLKNKVQFGAIFIMMFLGVFIFSGISSEFNGLQVSLDNYIKENNLADGWVYISDVNEKQLSELKQHQINYEQRMIIPVNDDKKDIDLYISSSNNISKLSISEGIAFNNEDDGIWLDAVYAKNNNYYLNDEITVNYQNFKITKKIIGLVYSPEAIYLAKEEQLVPNRQQYGFAYLNEKNFPLFQPYQLVLSSSRNITEIIDSIFEKTPYQLLLQKAHPVLVC